MRLVHVLIPEQLHKKYKKTPLQKKRVNYFLLWKLNKMRAQIDEIFSIHAYLQ